MAIPSPTIPSSTNAISAVRLNPTQNNKAFYVYSGEITVTTSDTTMISINDIGKRDILFCLEVGNDWISSNQTDVVIKSNGQVVYKTRSNVSYPYYLLGHDEIKLILPANTSLEVIMKVSGGSGDFNVAGYGYYLENFQ